jgi:replication-associated recombination protein RarA
MKHGLLNIDPWIAISLMQKAIRRGETATAQRAALTLYAAKKSATFRRLLIIASEDVGVGSIEALAAVSGAADAASRREQGGDIPVLLNLVRQLSEVPKDRSADISAAPRCIPGTQAC